MSKMIEATCQAGVVTADDVPVPSADILSEGVASSEGILLLDDDKAKYITSNALDLKETLDKVVSALEKVASALSSLDGAGFLIAASSGVPGPPVATSDISAINSIKAQLETLKENLR